MSEPRAFPSIPTKILLPIDFSPSSQAALEMAADLAKHFKANLHLVTVIPMFPTTTLPDFVPEAKFLQDARSLAERNLAKCHTALAARGVKATSGVETGNDVAGNIVEVVDREIIDMVVIFHARHLRLASNGLRVDCREGPETCGMPPPASAFRQARRQRESS